MPGLHISYRPDNFDEFIGNESTIKALKSKLNSDDRPHVYLITGPSGCGKTTLGRIIVNELGINNEFDFTELDSADFRGIDTVRSIRKNMMLSALSASKAYLLDEVHQLTGTAQEALLKALEDTPDHVYFILCTTDPQKLKVTLKRRCSHFEVKPVDEDDLSYYLKAIVANEDKQVPKKVIEQIISDSLGSLGMALVTLDKIIDLDEEDMAEQAKSYIESKQEAIKLARMLIAKKPWKTIALLLKELKDEDPEGLRRMILGYMSSVILNPKGNPDRAFLIMDSFKEPFYDTPRAKLIMACYESLYAD